MLNFLLYFVKRIFCMIKFLFVYFLIVLIVLFNLINFFSEKYVVFIGIIILLEIVNVFIVNIFKFGG